jgi:hypothetical protein
VCAPDPEAGSCGGAVKVIADIEDPPVSERATEPPRQNYGANGANAQNKGLKPDRDSHSCHWCNPSDSSADEAKFEL